MNLTLLAAALEAAGLRSPVLRQRGLWAQPRLVRQYLLVHGAPLVHPRLLITEEM